MRRVDRRMANDALNRLEKKAGRAKLASRPVELIVEPTNKCNSRCLMCLPHRRNPELPHPPSGFMTPETLRALEPAFVQARRVLLGGFGEPLMHPNYLEMLSWVRDRVPYVYMFTNATLIDKAVARGLVAQGMDAVVVSIGGASDATYRRVRGVPLKHVHGGLENLVAAKERERSAKPELKFNVVQMNSVLPEIRGIIDMAQIFGVTNIDMPQMWVESGEAASESVLDNDAARESLDEAAEYARVRGVEMCVSDLPPQAHRCDGPWSQLIVGYDGDVYSCTAERYRMGNVGEEPVLPLWQRGGFARLRALLREDPISLCPHCPVIEPEAYTNPALHGRLVSEEFDARTGPAHVRHERVRDAA